MAWTESAIFRAWMEDALTPAAGFTGGWGVNNQPGAPVPVGPGDYQVALFRSNAGVFTPAKNVPVGQTAYAGLGGVWLVADEVFEAPGWPQGGRPLENPSLAASSYLGPPNPPPDGSGVLKFDGDQTGNDLTAGTGVVTLADVAGDLLYWTPPNSVANQGAAFHSFGGVNQVTAGTFTIIWSAQGIMVQVV
jgi:hypothetical protein